MLLFFTFARSFTTISETIAEKAGIPSGVIEITDYGLKLIIDRHSVELEQMGLEPYDYVKHIASNFNQIRKGTGDSLLLVVFRKNISDVAAIDLSYNGKSWIVKTAQPRAYKNIVKNKLLWDCCPSIR